MCVPGMHWVCTKNQRARIDELMKKLPEDKTIIVTDFKMKFDPLYFCKKTIDFYEKKGLSCHSSMVYARYTTVEKEATTEAGDTLLDYHISYYDYISSCDSKYDYVTVLS